MKHLFFCTYQIPQVLVLLPKSKKKKKQVLQQKGKVNTNFLLRQGHCSANQLFRSTCPANADITRGSYSFPGYLTRRFYPWQMICCDTFPSMGFSEAYFSFSRSGMAVLVSWEKWDRCSGCKKRKWDFFLVCPPFWLNVGQFFENPFFTMLCSRNYYSRWCAPCFFPNKKTCHAYNSEWLWLPPQLLSVFFARADFTCQYISFIFLEWGY